MYKPAEDQQRFQPLDQYPHYLFDDQGIPLKDFGGTLGWQREPILPIYFARAYLKAWRSTGEAAMRRGLERMLDWLDGQLVPVGPPGAQGLTIYTHYDYLPYVRAPWICGMNAGRLLELYLDLHADGWGARYADLATGLVDGLLVPADEGGIVRSTALGGLVFEEFGCARPMLWSLNGHASVVVSLQRFQELFPTRRLAEVIDAATASVLETLDFFDVPNEAGGSKVKLYGFGLLRFRPARRGRGTSPLIHAITIHYPKDPPLTIPLGDSAGDRHAGWDVVRTDTVAFGAPERRGGRAGRAVGGETGKPYGILRIAMTDNFAVDDVIEIDLVHCSPETDVIVEFHPDRDGRYHHIGTAPATGHAWRMATLALPCERLSRGFGNVVGGEHPYHAMNTDYLDRLHAIRPDPRLAAMASRWRARIPARPDHGQGGERRSRG